LAPGIDRKCDAVKPFAFIVGVRHWTNIRLATHNAQLTRIGFFVLRHKPDYDNQYIATGDKDDDRRDS
jgi:hypothetical protein